MNPLLPWILLLVVDGVWNVETKLRYATEAECHMQGEAMALQMVVELQILNHKVDPKCVKG